MNDKNENYPDIYHANQDLMKDPGIHQLDSSVSEPFGLESLELADHPIGHPLQAGSVEQNLERQVNGLDPINDGEEFPEPAIIAPRYCTPKSDPLAGTMLFAKIAVAIVVAVAAIVGFQESQKSEESRNKEQSALTEWLGDIGKANVAEKERRKKNRESKPNGGYWFFRGSN